MAIGGGGGIVGILVLVAVLLLGGGEGGAGGLEVGLDSLLNQTAGGSTESVPSTLAEGCQTGEDANEREDCRIVAVINSVQAYWQSELASDYRLAQTEFFGGQTNTGCGAASSAVGPFYCPRGERSTSTSASSTSCGADFGAQRRSLRAGVHPCPRVRPPRAEHHRHARGARAATAGPESGAVRVELQADCLAGVWAANAVDTGFIEELTQDDRRRPQRRRRGRRRPHPGEIQGGVNPEIVDPRLLRAAPALVPRGLPAGRPRRLRHLRRGHLVGRTEVLRVLLLMRAKLERLYAEASSTWANWDGPEGDDAILDMLDRGIEAQRGR